MSILEVKKSGKDWAESPLRDVASPILEIDTNVEKLARDMMDTLVEQNGMGLAAPQVGQRVRLIVMRTNVSDFCPRAFVNPVIVRTKGEQLSLGEGCLSVPGRFGRVLRPRKLWMSYDDIATRERRTEEFQGIMAVCVAHEIDHLDGILFIDKLYNPLARRT